MTRKTSNAIAYLVVALVALSTWVSTSVYGDVVYDEPTAIFAEEMLLQYAIYNALLEEVAAPMAFEADLSHPAYALQAAINNAPPGVLTTIPLNETVSLSGTTLPTLEIPEGQIIALTGNGTLMGNYITTEFTMGDFRQEVTHSAITVRGTLTLDGITVTHNPGYRGNGVWVPASGTLIMHSGRIIGNTADLHSVGSTTQPAGTGGGVNVQGSFRMYDGEISGNRSSRGGGVAVAHNGVFEMRGGTIFGNTPDGVDVSCGIVTSSSNFHATFHMHDGSIDGSIEQHTTGVRIGMRGTFNMHGGTIAHHARSGVEVGAAGFFNMHGGVIAYNGGIQMQGGGVWVQQGTDHTTWGPPVVRFGTFTMHDGAVIRNNTGISGGGIRASSGTTFMMYGGLISGNTARDAGGGVLVSAIAFHMHGGTIENNTVVGGGFGPVGPTAARGGGIFFDAGTLASEMVIHNGTIRNNTAALGGGIYANAFHWVHFWTRPVVEIRGGSIVGNTATADGGGIWMPWERMAGRSHEAPYDPRIGLGISDTAIISGNTAGEVFVLTADDSAELLAIGYSPASLPLFNNQNIAYTRGYPITDRTNLYAAIASADTRDEALYTPTTWASLAYVLEAAIVIRDNPMATQTQINNATQNLLSAINALALRPTPTPPPVMFTVTFTLEGNGHIMALIPEMGWVEESPVQVREGYDLLFGAIPEPGHRLVRWYLDGSKVQPEFPNSLLVYDLAANVSVHVVFEAFALSEWEEAIAEAQSRVSSNYTAESWAYFHQVFLRTSMILGSLEATQACIDAATNALWVAINALVRVEATPAPTPTPAPVSDRSHLSAAIMDAENRVMENYTAMSWTRLGNQLRVARSVYANEHATQEQIDASADRLWDAINGLVLAPPPLPPPSEDRSGLAAAITEAENRVMENYTAMSWTRLTNQLRAARSAYANESITQEQVDAATDRLWTEINGLALAPPPPPPPSEDRSGLAATITEAENLVMENYTPASWTRLMNQLRVARSVYANERATQAQIDAAENNMRTSINGLVYR
jgi:hypothetical protein